MTAVFVRSLKSNSHALKNFLATADSRTKKKTKQLLVDQMDQRLLWSQKPLNFKIDRKKETMQLWNQIELSIDQTKHLHCFAFFLYVSPRPLKLTSFRLLFVFFCSEFLSATKPSIHCIWTFLSLHEVFF